MPPALHVDATVIDGLQIAKWTRETFEDMLAGGLTAVNCTCAVWENFAGTMTRIAQFKQWFRDYSDILCQVYTTDDIARAKRDNRVGVILGFQNTSPIEDRLAYLALFKELGVGIVQLTYNTQNYVGGGCLERGDAGLTGFGRDVVSEMNRLGVVIDLSHVGPTTAMDVVNLSTQPVVYSHTCPVAFKPHPRNKTDEEMRAVTDRGGIVGVNLLPRFYHRGPERVTVNHYLDMMEYVVGVVGEDHVGIGTDFTQGQDAEFFDWVVRDKGDGRVVKTDYSVAALVAAEGVDGLSRIRDFPNLTSAMERRGWSEQRIRKILGANWMRLLRAVWGS